MGEALKGRIYEWVQISIRNPDSIPDKTDPLESRIWRTGEFKTEDGFVYYPTGKMVDGLIGETLLNVLLSSDNKNNSYEFIRDIANIVIETFEHIKVK